ncbi:MAG TPA: hypothetical protein VM871_10800 [Flavisolibacter sp.]|jgi:hypothetical protein|nr:hypothetical protein [Flavisolibacter sp.]
MKTINNLLCGLACCFCVSAFGQQQTDTTESINPQIKLSLNYNTGLNFYGRTDSLKSSGFFPLAELWLTPNFYVNAAPIFVNNAVQRFDYAGTVATVGYQNVTQKWITGLYVSKPFYKESSELVQSALKVQSGANVSFLNKYVNLNVGGNLNYSNKADFGASGGVDHLIRIQAKNGSVLVFDPSFYVYAGSQNFQRSYSKKVSNGSFLFPSTSEQVVTENVSSFSILAYEASMPVVYAKNSWTFVALPAYIIPQNLLTVPGRPDLSENGQAMFYATLTAKYTF